MTTYTPEIRARLEQYLATHTLPKGIGSKESACSIAAINLAISGKMTDDIPNCMSEVIGCATITLQDAMPDQMRNGERYKAWLPTAVGTGREREQERLKILIDWMWRTVLPQLQPLADEKGFGKEWRTMCSERTQEAAYAARAAAYAARVAAYAAYAVDAVAADAADYAARAARAARVAARVAADAADYAARAARAADAAAYAVDAVAADAADYAARAADAADYAVRVAAYAVDAVAAARAARAADAAAYAVDAVAADAADYAARAANFWQTVDPIGVLERMTNLEKTQ